MKEKRSKKESNKEEAKKEGHTGLDFAPLQQASPSEDLKINWEAFIRFFNATLQMHAAPKPAASRKRSASAGHGNATSEPRTASATRNTSG